MVIIGASQALDPGSIPGERSVFLGALAQSEARVLCKHEVRGSKPRCSINFFLLLFRRPLVSCLKSVVHAGKSHRLQAWMAEWSKAVDSSSILFGGVGSNPTPSNFLMVGLHCVAILALWLHYFECSPSSWAIGLVV